MGSFLTARDYSPLTKYYLSSEAVEPGHGWYWNMTRADSALSMALELYDGFFAETQNPDGDFHLTPKTLSIVDTALFDNFRQEFEAFVTELADLIYFETDPEYYASIQRTRAVVTAFDSISDNPGTRFPSAVDIGSFLSKFDEQCSLSQSSPIRSSYDRTLAAYDQMFTARGYGVGTKPSTGMALYWPSKQQYNAEPWYIEDELWHIDDGDTSYAWLDFVEVYLNSTTPLSSNGASACTNTLSSEVEIEYEGQLLLNPQVFKLSVGIMAESDITINTDVAYTEYGFYLEGAARRRLGYGARRLSNLHSRPRTSIGKRMKNNRAASLATNPKKRSLQYEEYTVIFHGALPSNYDGPTYSGYWNEYIYILHEYGDNNDTVAENVLVYADDQGDGSLSIPVLYFPPSITVDDSTILPFVTLVEDALVMGGAYGELQYTIDELTGEVISPVSLYTNADAGDVASAIYEKPRDAGGSIVPVVFAEEGFADGEFEFVEYVGRVHGWNDGLDVAPIDLSIYADFFGRDAMVFDMYAIDLDLPETEIGAVDLHLFGFNLTDGTIESLMYDEEFPEETVEDTVEEGSPEETETTPMDTTSGCNNRATPCFVVLGATTIVTLLFN